MATRVFELARELGVRSKDVLDKCRAEGIELKNHMASLSAGLEETIRDWFSDSGAHTAVETAAHVDLEEARKKAKKSRRRSKPKETPEEPAAETPEEKPQGAEPSAAPAAEPAKEPPAEAPEEKPAPEAPQPVSESPKENEPPDKPKAKKPKKEKPVAPAGPQVVPKPAQLKGPRVVRVEEPDYAPRPQPRQSTPPVGRPPLPLREDDRARGGGGDKEEGKGRGKKTSRRSPRRKGGRSETVEKIKEWRNQDLLERSERIAGAGHTLRRRRVSSAGPHAAAAAKSGKVEITEPITVKSLSAATGLKGAEIIKKLMGMGTMATINQVISAELAESIVMEYGIELVVQRAKTAEEELLERLKKREQSEQTARAPVVTFLGHVDHGKTSLLDRIRKTTVASGEAGGITQAIGAYRHDLGEQHVVFLDTPGHEAFTAMRARGANMTDVVVLVVAADDGVMPQTVEAISHAKAAGVPIVVALNKVDVPNANIQRALGQLAEHDLQPRQWGGETEVIETSAATGQGIEELVELLSLEAEILELQAEIDAPASGYVVEARMDPGQGALATLLVRNGTLKVGDNLLAGRGFGRVRQIYDHRGQPLQQAGPSTPVAVTGLDEVPEAGDRFYIVSDGDEARGVALSRRSEDRARNLAAAVSTPRSLEELLGKIEDGEVTQLPVIVKADVQGSIEALTVSLQKIGSAETRLNILHTAVGGISTGDVTLAEASGAVILGFNVVADPAARRLAEEKKIDIRLYRVIYDLIEDMRRALEEGLAPEIKEESLGRAEVRRTFKISRLGTIAGCYVSEGVAQRSAKVRIIRNNVVLEDNRSLDSLKREKDDAREVKAGLECGIKIAGFDDVKEGDVLEFYKKVEVARTLA
ncbi:MAG: translation initiation factor IF-2 [Phycisphaerae bacterium]|nr:translation initiation factor IF-2 [Phycisphaerae bacterium]